jgi:hypothetical protein
MRVMAQPALNQAVPHVAVYTACCILLAMQCCRSRLLQSLPVGLQAAALAACQRLLLAAGSRAAVQPSQRSGRSAGCQLRELPCPCQKPLNNAVAEPLVRPALGATSSSGQPWAALPGPGPAYMVYTEAKRRRALPWHAFNQPLVKPSHKHTGVVCNDDCPIML